MDSIKARLTDILACPTDDFQTLIDESGLSKHSDLKYGDFSQCDLRQMDFANCDLSGTSFRQASLKQACFKNATFQQTDFSYALMQYTDFSGCNRQEIIDASVLVVRDAPWPVRTWRFIQQYAVELVLTTALAIVLKFSYEWISVDPIPNTQIPTRPQIPTVVLLESINEDTHRPISLSSAFYTGQAIRFQLNHDNPILIQLLHRTLTNTQRLPLWKPLIEPFTADPDSTLIPQAYSIYLTDGPAAEDYLLVVQPNPHGVGSIMPVSAKTIDALTPLIDSMPSGLVFNEQQMQADTVIYMARITTFHRPDTYD